MALKPRRQHVDSTISWYMDEVAERGGIVCVSTAGSGALEDQSLNLVTYKAAASGGKPVGLLMSDVVNLDLTRQHLNWNKEEVQKGSKVTIWHKGTVVTDMVDPGVTPTAGQIAYLGPSGLVTNVETATGGEATKIKVGRFMGPKDEDGFAELYVDLP